MRLASCWRVSSSLPSASTLRAIAAGVKSSMLSNVSSTLRFPSPVSVFGTWKATRGFIAFIRLSKLSTSISRNLRSGTSGSGSAGFPDRSASTPMTKGSWIFFSAPYSSTSYSIWTRGARLRAMNFVLLALATNHLQMRARRAAGLLVFDAAHGTRFAERTWRDVGEHFEKTLGDETPRTVQQQRDRARRLRLP